MIEACIGDAEMGTVEFDRDHAVLGQRESDDRWIVVVPVTFEALRSGEQHCVISGHPSDLRREYVESGEAWGDGELAEWLESDRLWYES